MGYKILHVGTFGCVNADYISDTFEELGHKVTRREESEMEAEEVIMLARDHDFLLVEEGRLEGDHYNLGGRNKIIGKFQDVIDNITVPVVSWLTNIFWSMEQREEEIKTNPIFKANIVFSTDGGHQKEFEEAGVNHFLLRQGIYEPEAYIGKPVYPTNAEIGFIGSIYANLWPYRENLINELKTSYGAKFEHFGQDSSIRHDDLNNLIATLKIVVGDSVESPKYWSNRLYEMIGRGAFLIFPYIEGIEEEFTPGEHFVTYRYGDFEGLKRKIDYYLENEDEREKIKLAGMKHCINHHTYQKRVKKMLCVLKEQNIL